MDLGIFEMAPQKEDQGAPISFQSELNAEQYAAVTAPQGDSALVLAGAGSGKTRTLTYRVAWLLSQGVNPWEILLVTFTNKAAREMLERVEQLTRVSGRKFWGGTFYSIGQRILRMHGDAIGISSNYNILDAGEAESILADAIKEVASSFLKDKENPKPRVISEIISYARNTCNSVLEVVQNRYPFFGHLLEEVVAFQNKFQERKLKQQVLDYDDLLVYWLKLLKENQEIATQYQNRFKNILVDEYQDTNKLQALIIDLIAKDHQIMAVGDDAQCIYTWRGANFDNIMTFPQRHPGTKIYKIETNYRSTPDILNFANKVLENQPVSEGYRKELRAVRERKQKPCFVPTIDTRHQAQFIIQRIKCLLFDGYEFNDIAVLYRAHYQSMDLQMELSKQGIPYQVTSGVRFFEQAHIKDLIAQLRFVSNPLDGIAFNRFACLLPKVGPKSAEKLLKLSRELAYKENKSVFAAMSEDPVVKKVTELARDDWVDLAYTLQNLHESCARQKPSELIKLAVDGWYGDFLKDIYPNWKFRQDDLDSVVGFASRYDSMQDLLAQLVLMSVETSDRSVELTANSVRLTTVHQSKGLEFPLVFVIGVSENLFPLKRAIEEGGIEEERRLFYVAVTRSKDQLYMIHPKVAMQGGPSVFLKPSRFIQEISEDVYEILDIKQRRY